jgi:hypothetical protein
MSRRLNGTFAASAASFYIEDRSRPFFENSQIMTILSFFKHHFTADRAAYFDRPAQDQGLPLDFGNDRRLAELLSSNEDVAGNLEKIAKLLG